VCSYTSINSGVSISTKTTVISTSDLKSVSNFDLTTLITTVNIYIMKSKFLFQKILFLKTPLAAATVNTCQTIKSNVGLSKCNDANIINITQLTLDCENDFDVIKLK
jgi:hypothetical protein